MSTYWVLCNIFFVLLDAFTLALSIRQDAPLKAICWCSIIFGFQCGILVWVFCSWTIERSNQRLMDEFRKRFP